MKAPALFQNRPFLLDMDQENTEHSIHVACNAETVASDVPHADVAIIGAGPAGMFAVFELGLLGLRCHVFDALPVLGGQCRQLYGDKLIYDIPAVMACSGLELTERLTQQMQPFAPVLHLGEQVQSISAARAEDNTARWLVQGSRGSQVAARALVVAAGVGAFMPRTLKLEGEAALAHTHIHYHCADVAALGLAHQAVIVSGGDELAVAAALEATQAGAASVTLVHRREVFNAPAAMLAALQAAVSAGHIRTLAAQPVALKTKGTPARLQAVEFTTSTGQTHSVAASKLLVYQGISPKLGPLAEWGLALHKKHVCVDTASFAATLAPQTPQGSLPAKSLGCAPIHAIGDICTYAGKRKLIVSGFHEATLAAFAIAEHLSCNAVALQYTSSSSQLQTRLGVIDAQRVPT